MNKWVKYLLWIIGMFLIIWLGNHIITVTRLHESATAVVGPAGWALAIVPVLYGAYLSLLFIKRPSRVNFPLLILVCLPSILFDFYIPVSFQLHLMLYSWMTQVNGITGIVAGLTLMLSILG